MSVVTDFLQIIYQEANRVGSHSWINLNRAMHDGLRLAIQARFMFEPDDFVYIAKHFKFAYWARLDNSGKSRGEEFYKCAIESNNLSAAIAFEAYKGRSPFIYCGQRLAIGSSFMLPRGLDPEAQIWRVNSFSEDGSMINCAHYATDDRQERRLSERLIAKKSLTKKELKEQEKILRVLLSTKQPRPFDVVLGSIATVLEETSR